MRTSSITLFALFIFSLVSRPAFSADYKVDLSFLTHKVILQNGNEAESDAYNADSSNQSAHPVFSELADLDLNGQIRHVYLIASRHDGEADVRFVEAEIARLQIPRTATLFVEQADPLALDGASTVLTEVIAQKVPQLSAALARAQKNPRSVLSPVFASKLTFAQVARHWQNSGGQAVNMDLSQNFQLSAIEFLMSQLEKKAAERFIRLELDGETFTFPELQTLMSFVYSPPFQDVGKIKDCCGTARDWINTFLADNQVRDLTRERYMRYILFNQLKDGDVIITHPVHMRHLLNPERRP